MTQDSILDALLGGADPRDLIADAIAAGARPEDLAERWGTTVHEILKIKAERAAGLTVHPAVARAEARAAGGPVTAVVLRTVDLEAAAARPNPDMRLSAEAAELIFQGLAPNTRRTWKSQYWKFVQWCAATGRDHEPGQVTPETVVEWILENGRRLGRYGRPTAPETVKTSLKTIAAAHRRARRPDVDSNGRHLMGYPTPTSAPMVLDAMKTYTRQWLEAGHRPDKAYPLTRAELARLILTLDLRTPMGVMNQALLSIGYDLGARRVELAAMNIDDLNFVVADWNDITEEDFLAVTIPMSKTDQSGEGAEVILFAHPATDTISCPVRNGKKHLDQMAAAGYVQGAFFRVVHTGGVPRKDGQPKSGKILDKRIAVEHVPYLVERCMERSGLRNAPGKRKHVVPHSLRHGPATEAGAAGATAAAINAHFRWSQNGTTGQRYEQTGRRASANPMRKVWQQATQEANRDV